MTRYPLKAEKKAPKEEVRVVLLLTRSKDGDGDNSVNFEDPTGSVG